LKKILFLSILAIGKLTSCSETPPTIVSDFFSEQFANAKKVSWGHETESEWEAEFMMDGKEMSATYDDAGIWMETEIEIEEDELPELVKNALDQNFKFYKLGEVSIIETSDFKGYEVIVETNDQDIEVLITNEGELTIKELLDEDND